MVLSNFISLLKKKKSETSTKLHLRQDFGTVQSKTQPH